MKNLIGMTDFVLEQKETSTIDTDQGDWYCMELEKLDKIRKYANFLNQPLELWMFVPCDEDGVWVVLEEPKGDCCGRCIDGLDECISEIHQEYQQAKEKCLFDGWKITKNTTEYIRLKKQEFSIIFFIKNESISFYNAFCDNYDIETIEDLIKYNLQLTQTALKQLSL